MLFIVVLVLVDLHVLFGSLLEPLESLLVVVLPAVGSHLQESEGLVHGLQVVPPNFQLVFNVLDFLALVVGCLLHVLHFVVDPLEHQAHLHSRGLLVLK